jgi:hypothetical protein
MGGISDCLVLEVAQEIGTDVVLRLHVDLGGYVTDMREREERSKCKMEAAHLCRGPSIQVSATAAL